jgi:hypothetical protein
MDDVPDDRADDFGYRSGDVHFYLNAVFRYGSGHGHWLARDVFRSLRFELDEVRASAMDFSARAFSE